MRVALLFAFAVLAVSMNPGRNLQKSIDDGNYTPQVLNLKRCGPVADAGPNQSLPYATPSTILDGSNSFAQCGRTIVSYFWTYLSGPGGSLSPDNTYAVIDFDFMGKIDDWVLQLEVTDNTGAKSTSTVAVSNRGPSPFKK